MDDKRIEAMRDVMKVQSYDGNWNYDPYMFGMYNGMELMLSLAEGREPIYREKPKEWVVDNPTEHVVVAEGQYSDATESAQGA